MSKNKTVRINISSGRAIEEKAKFSRTIRVNDLVLQSGTTAINRSGKVLGSTVGEQVKAVMSIAEKSMAAADGNILNTFRARLYVKGKNNIRGAEDAFIAHFKGNPPATTCFEISGLTRPQQLVEIELEALTKPPLPEFFENKKKAAQKAGALKLASRIFIPGYITKGENMTAKISDAGRFLHKTLTGFELKNSDIVSIRFYCSNIEDLWRSPIKLAELCGLENPTVVFIGVPTENTLIIEAEATANPTTKKEKNIHPVLAPFSESLCVDSDIYLSSIYPTGTSGEMLAPENWSEQRSISTANLKTVLERANSNLNDVAVRRYFTLHSVSETNYDEGPPWFESTRPSALGCRVNHHALKGALISLDSHAIRGAGENIVKKNVDE